MRTAHYFEEHLTSGISKHNSVCLSSDRVYHVFLCSRTGTSFVKQGKNCLGNLLVNWFASEQEYLWAEVALCKQKDLAFIL